MLYLSLLIAPLHTMYSISLSVTAHEMEKEEEELMAVGTLFSF
jgi:hypothetical protein